jgi:hypothetical protein
MCRAVRCGICGKVTWAGCGDHVEQALVGVPAEERCPGHESAWVSERSRAAWPPARPAR